MMDDAMVVPDGIEPVVGWRQWAIRFERGVGVDAELRSLNQFASIWPGRGRAEAVCGAGGKHAVPDADCRCGFYAKQDLGKLVSEYEPAQTHPPDFRVVGRCFFWGRIVEHEDGVRAQYAYPDRLWLIVPELFDDEAAMAVAYHELMPTCDAIQDAYGVPCTPAFVRELRNEVSPPAMFASTAIARVEQFRHWGSMGGYSLSGYLKAPRPTTYTISPSGRQAQNIATATAELAMQLHPVGGPPEPLRDPLTRMRRVLYGAIGVNVAAASFNLVRAFGLF